jgi:hypothetical protein
MLVDGTTVAFTVSEFGQGSVDLNGDGDVEDRIAHVFDVREGRVRNLRLDTGQMLLRGRLLAIFASEFGNADLNGDGDQDDQVLHVFDTERQTLRNLGVAVFPSIDQALFDGRRLAIGVDELSQDADLNGDGDASDGVVHVFDVQTGRLQNTRLATEFAIERFDVSLGGRFIGVRVAEVGQGGSDLNGDGDADDSVVHIFDTARGTSFNTGLAVFFDGGFRLGAGVALVSANEISQNADLNRDGDRSDLLLQQVDLGSGRIRSIDLPLLTGGFQFDPDQGIATFDVSEEAAGVDLDGNGMLQDAVAHALFTGSGRTLNLRRSGFVLRIAPRARLVFAQGEVASDLNDDGDQSDAVVQLIDLRPLRVVNTGRALSLGAGPPFPPALDPTDGDFFAFLVGESEQGSRDLNGDGDATDAVLHFADLSSFAVTNSSLDGQLLFAVPFGPLLPPSRGRIAVPVAEFLQGRDLNGDGALDDGVLQIFDLRTRAVVNTRVAVPQLGSLPLLAIVRGDGFVSVATPEDGIDLNGDGDGIDPVLQLVDLATATVTNTRRAVGINVGAIAFVGLTGTSSFFVPGFAPFGISQDMGVLSPGPGPGDAFSFGLSESDQGVDVNGDGDFVDIIVNATRLVDRDGDRRFDFATANP